MSSVSPSSFDPSMFRPLILAPRQYPYYVEVIPTAEEIAQAQLAKRQTAIVVCGVVSVVAIAATIAILLLANSYLNQIHLGPGYFNPVTFAPMITSIQTCWITAISASCLAFVCLTSIVYLRNAIKTDKLERERQAAIDALPRDLQEMPLNEAIQLIRSEYHERIETPDVRERRRHHQNHDNGLEMKLPLEGQRHLIVVPGLNEANGNGLSQVVPLSQAGTPTPESMVIVSGFASAFSATPNSQSRSDQEAQERVNEMSQSMMASVLVQPGAQPIPSQQHSSPTAITTTTATTATGNKK